MYAVRRNDERPNLPDYHERLHPSTSPLALFSSHSERYELAATMAKGDVVVDIACGSGYGSAILADRGASLVISGDISGDALRIAERDFARPVLRLVRVNAVKLPIKSGTIDLVVSLETLEHVRDPAACIREFHRVLRARGRAVISTPNKTVVSPDSDSPSNPYHIREFTLGEFASSLGMHFSDVTLYGQGFVSTHPFPDVLRRASSIMHYPWLHRLHKKLKDRVPDSMDQLMNRGLLRYATCPSRLQPIEHDSDLIPAYITAVCRK